MSSESDSRAKALWTAGTLFQERGYAAVGLAEIIERSGSPKGSFYFHFRGGKEQLAAEALTATGRAVNEILRGLADRCPTPARLIRDYVALLEQMITTSQYRQGCPVATVTLEMASESELIRRAADAAFASWVETLSQFLHSHGRDRHEADRLAEHIVTTLEGALLLARAQHSPRPLHNAAKTLTSLIG
jgi:TetR/AcrR family transcriptional repressor of lmrAB and yxaGH operons